MPKRKAGNSAAERPKKPKPDYMTDPAQFIEQLKTLHGWHCQMLDLLRKTLPPKPQNSQDEPSSDGM